MTQLLATLPPRIASNFLVNAETGCWEWTAYKDKNGYGRIVSARRGRPPRSAYRVIYELAVGPIPDGLELDHACHTRDQRCPGGVECRHRRCVNPEHLEPVTHAENLRRGKGVEPAAELKRAATHCRYGHPYDEANTYYQPAGGRACRACKRQVMRRIRAGKRTP